MALTDTQIRSAKPQEKPYKLFDSGGLFLFLPTSGGKLWRLKYRLNNKENLLALGAYPEVSLREAREKRDLAKKLIVAGIDPNADKKRKSVEAQIASDNTFKAIAAEFINKKAQDGLAAATINKSRWFASLLDGDLGKRPVSEIEPHEILACIKKIEKKGHHETAKRMRAFASRVFRYAIITSRARVNPASELGAALIMPKVRHHSAIIDPQAVGELMRAIETYQGRATTKWALKLTPHVFVRPGELRQAEWAEFDLDAKTWCIPAKKMKMRKEHVVPLSRQAVAILLEMKKLTSSSRYVFPATHSDFKPMSENTINLALRRLGYSKAEMTAHGFRSTASTLLNESGKWSADAIERALAHKDSNAIRSAYHRGTHWNERVEMAQWWSDYLDTLRSETKLLQFKRKILN